MVILLIFFTIQTNLIKSNVFRNHIFIFYRNNHKCNIETIINNKYKFSRTKMNSIQFSQKFKRQVNENIHFFNKSYL